ncbi:MAG: hypothetical protein LH632_13775 [Rhodoferax sp.]|nr:hypothetical protein [Rhodoferax sp.]
MQLGLSPAMLAFIAALSMTSAAVAQPVYKCGNTYSQSPCPGATAVNTEDTRSAAQKAQTDAAAANAAKTAARMEKERVARDQSVSPKAPSKAARPVGTTSEEAQPVKSQANKKKPSGPEYFTAAVPPVKTKKSSGSGTDTPKPENGPIVKP